MSIVGDIQIGDLTWRLPLHKFSSGGTVHNEVTVWAKIIGYPSLTYWTSGSLGFVIRTPTEIPSEDEWVDWFFVYSGKNYTWYQFWIDMVSRGQFAFVEARSASFGSGGGTDLPASNVMYNSDALAAAAGLGLGDPYWAGAAHDRASYGSLTQRLE